jgi:outer membrane protein OmpA-like peptidoglycan-associated protein
VIVLGDQILIAIPSDRLFQPATSTIKPQAYSTLNMVAKYINSFTKMLVKISAYTDASGSQRVDQVLSQQQAQNVAKYLSADGVDARLLYAIGNGGTKLVQKNSQDWYGNDNYRIEITMEKLHV